MAKRNRKLFPSLTYTNETTYCPDFCDPTTCPYDCPTFIPYLPPPLPPPPPPSPSSGATHVSPSFITASSILVAFFFLIGYYIIIAKSCFRRPTRDSARPAVETEFVDGNRVDHPIWLIATVGLQQSVINTITICQYRKGEGLIEGTECSVCLNEFREEETLRLLPKCSHAFHISCIDTWLRSHTNCPLCRANIVTTDDVGFVSAADSAAGEDSRVSLEIQVEDTQNRGETEEGRNLQEVELVVNGDSGTKEMNVGDKNEIEQGIVTGMDCYSSSEGIQETEEGRKQRIGKGVVFRDKDMVGVERSQSCNGGFFLSRHSRSTSSILP